MPPSLPLVALTADLPVESPPAYASRCAYAEALRRAGALPVILPPPVAASPTELEHLASRYADAFDAFVFTGGADPVTEPFGQPTHPAAKRLHPARQAFELALFAALDQPRHRDKPVLAICLGMQLMALHNQGVLNQHLPDSPHADSAPQHLDNQLHDVLPARNDHPVITRAGRVASSHHQAVSDPGRLRVVARAPDQVIEAIDDPSRAFYLGTQWHPERTPDGPESKPLGDDLFRALVARVKPRP